MPEINGTHHISRDQVVFFPAKQFRFSTGFISSLNGLPVLKKVISSTMEARPFAGLNPKPSPWGYNWTTENISSTDYRPPPPPNRDNSAQNSPVSTTSSPEPQMMEKQYANMPAALLTSMKRDKKPFTYTPGGVNLSEVLNHRLQKRMERKKKYSEDRMNANPIEALPRFEQQRQLVVMPTYNTPLDMYSMENALEALEVQAGLVDSYNRSATLPRNHKFDDKNFDEGRGVAQSKAFKVLQIITDTDEEPFNKGRGNQHFQDEMRFTGIRDSKSIPSKFFQTLQKITGTDEEEEDANNTDMTRVEAPRPSVYEKQQQSRPGFLPQQVQCPVNVQNHVVPQFQPMQNHRMVSNQESFTGSPSLRRPAAFLPMKTGSDPLNRIKPVHPPFLANGPRNTFGPSGGTDF